MFFQEVENEFLHQANCNDFIKKFQKRYFGEFREEIQLHKNEVVTINVKRGLDTLNLEMQLGDDGFLGVFRKIDLNEFFALHKKTYSVVEAIPAGFNRTWAGIGNY